MTQAVGAQPYRKVRMPDFGTSATIRKVNLLIVTDCGGTDEGRYRIAAERCFHPHQVSVTFFATRSLNTLHAGFVTAAHALSAIDHFGPLPEDEVWGILDNAAPRAEDGLRGLGRRVSGEDVFTLILDNRVVVVGPNAGHNFHFIRPRVKESYLVEDVTGQKTPFRSMEVMIPALAESLIKVRFLCGETPRLCFLNKELQVPQVPTGTFVGDVDSHGNMYLVTIGEPLRLPPVGNQLQVTIADQAHIVRYVDGIFAGTTGELCLTYGSLTLGGQPVPYLVRVGGSAHAVFGYPDVAARVALRSTEPAL